MEKIEIITHNGKRIVFFDAKNMEEKEICEGIKKLTDIAIANKINLLMLDVKGTRTTPMVRETASQEVERVTEHLGTVYSSIIGLSSIQRLIANAIKKDQYLAAGIQDAKNWLSHRAEV